MAPGKDICRICVQETDKNDVQDLNWKNLDPFITNTYLPDPLEVYEGHVICCSCIDNFNTIRNLHRLVTKSNIILTRLKTSITEESATITEMNLKDIFNSHVGDDIAICRLCLDTTKHVAIRLFETSSNLVPPDYLKAMLSDINIHLVLLDETKKPIICYQCWQRIQVSYGFHKQLDVAMKKLQLYQKISQNMFLKQKDLEDILYMWDKLDFPDTPPLEIHPDQSLLQRPTDVSSSSLVDHDYCNNNSTEDLEPNNVPVLGSRANSDVDLLSDMPVLRPNVHDSQNSIHADTCKKPLQNKIVIKENRKVNLKRSNHKKSSRDRIRISNSISNGDSHTANKREKRISILKSTLLGTPLSNDMPVLHAAADSINPKRYNLRSSNGLSFKEEDDDFEDLLVLKKQVVIKAKPIQKKKNFFRQLHTSTPNLQNLSNIPNSTKSQNCNDYTIERLNFDSYVQLDRSRLPEQEIQIKAEILSDSDDDFIEETPGIFTDPEPFNDNYDGLCPSLVGFVKTEPEELVDVTGIEDEPPELDFQGPCNSFSNLSISNNHASCGVDQKRRYIECADVSQMNATLDISNAVVETMASRDTSKRQNANEELVETLPEQAYSNGDMDSMPQLDSNYDPLSIDSPPKSGKSKRKGKTRSKRPSTLPDVTQIGEQTEDGKPETKCMKTKAQLPGVPYACTKCSYMCITKRSIVFHNEMHNTKKATLLSCEFCSFLAINKDTFRRHRKTHLDNPGHEFCFECQLHSPTIYCLKCSKDFHAACLLAHQSKNTDCIHFGIEGVLNLCKRRDSATLTAGNSSNHNVSCVYCKKTAAKSYIDCQICERQFHYECFYARDKKCLTVCMHLVKLLRRIYLKGEGVKIRCKMCGRILEYVTPCLSCHAVMHYGCFTKHAAMVSADCRHDNILHGLPLDMQSPSAPQLQPSTSFNEKREHSKFSDMMMQF